MTRGTTRLHIAREAFKFSCAHVTIFPDGRAERLHGHNYMASAEVDLLSSEFANMIDFNAIKVPLAACCAAWKEHVLIATQNPFCEITESDPASLQMVVGGKRYVFPREDALLLPVSNISAECLAQHLAEILISKIDPATRARIAGLHVRVDESPGQGATHSLTGL